MDEVSHKGRITAIGPDFTTVEILRTSACGECRAKSFCGMGESQTKTVLVPTDGFAMHSEGEEVEVCIKRTMGLKAVWISYVIPLMVLLAAVLAVPSTGAGELATGLTAIGAVALYYLVIFLLRGRLNNEFVFYIK